jgi:chemotaxis protein methyltransferase CheR
LQMLLPQMDDSEFEDFRKLIHESIGISLSLQKKQLLMTRLYRRMYQLGINSYGEYWAHVLNDETGSEMVLLLNAVSTNKTDFFRESDHFTFLKNEVYPQLQKQQTIRIWSCACSSGEEAYTIAMTLLDAFGGVLGGRDAKILATDISTRMLDQAELGRYPVNQLPLIPEVMRNRYCQILPETNGEMFQVSSQLKALIRFRRLNLIQEYPLRTQFDFIMCRNVMIYFDRDDQEKLIERLSGYIKPGGYLFVGHSESLIGLQNSLKYVQSSIYQRI